MNGACRRVVAPYSVYQYVLFDGATAGQRQPYGQPL